MILMVKTTMMLMTVAICGGPATALEVFFAVEVDLAKDAAKVLINIDPNKLDGTKYEINMR